MRILSHVDHQVHFKALQRREGHPTDGAPVSVVPRVDLLVPLQRGLQSELFVANGALVRSFPGVHQHMDLQLRVHREHLPAHCTLVHLLVDQYVLLEVVKRSKLLPADGTGVRFISGVYQFVSSKGALLCEPLEADVALKGFAARVYH